MSAERFEITLSDDGLIHISGSNGRRASLITPDGIIGYVTHGAIRQQARDLEIRNEWYANALNDLDDKRSEITKLRTDLAAAAAELDSYRDEFSGLCYTLSVGSEGRPEMTAADWRKRVDQGIDFLTRPLLSRIEATDKELAKRSSMLDICTQNCSDWIGRWRAEQERAEQAEARLAAIDAAPTIALTFCHPYSREEPGQLIARPAKD